MRPRRDVPQDGVRRNEQIRAREVRVIGPEGEQIGILPCSDAIAMAHEAGYDLVEVAANAEPPVCRIMDFGKFKYEQQQKKKEAKRNQTVVQIKEIKVRPKTMTTKPSCAISVVSLPTAIAARLPCSSADARSCTRIAVNPF